MSNLLKSLPSRPLFARYSLASSQRCSISSGVSSPSGLPSQLPSSTRILSSPLPLSASITSPLLSPPKSIPSSQVPAPSAISDTPRYAPYAANTLTPIRLAPPRRFCRLSIFALMYSASPRSESSKSFRFGPLWNTFLNAFLYIKPSRFSAPGFFSTAGSTSSEASVSFASGLLSSGVSSPSSSGDASSFFASASFVLAGVSSLSPLRRP